LEVRVGMHHSAEVVLHLRRADLYWFNNKEAQDNKNNAANNSRFSEVLELLQTSIIPRLFADEIERTHFRKEKIPPPPRLLGPGGVPIQVAEKQQHTSKHKRLTKKQKQEAERQQHDDEKKEKDVYYASGSTLQLAFKLEEPRMKRHVTLLFGGAKERGTMKELSKLSKRILLWCYRLAEVPDVAHLQPEMIPISALFQSKEDTPVDVDQED
jgi:hypothetical protein